jgi:flagellar motor switch protein FliN
MTDTTASPQPEAADYLQAWAQSLSQVLGTIAGTPVPCVTLSAMPAGMPADPAALWILCACAGGLRGEMSFRLIAASVLHLAQIFMSQPAAAEVQLTDDHRAAVVELLRQVAGIVATSFKVRGGEIQFGIDVTSGPASWPASSTMWLQAGEDGPSAIFLELHLSAALVAGLRADQTEAAAAITSPLPSASPAPHSIPSPPPPPPSAPAVQVQGNEKKLEMLMDVQLAMTLRFGGRQLLLREILDLTPGTVIELDRQVQEAVDVLLDGRLVARGEVVVMDGNYGLRVTEVVSAAGP